MAITFKIRILLFLASLQKKIDVATISPETFRAYGRNARTKLNIIGQYAPEKLFLIQDKLIPVSMEEEIKVRIYKARDTPQQPLLMYFHGGGFVSGDIDSHDLTCRRLAKQNNCVVVSVDYRLAPEYPFPIPCEDAYVATRWAIEHAADLGVNSNQVVVMGDSAGGNLATVVAMMARDNGEPKIACQILIYPSTDATLSMDSINKLGSGYLLTRELIEWFIKNYCGNEKDLKQPYLSPLFAKNLSGLPPTLIVTAEYDPLKDEGETYANRLKEAGNHVVFKEYKGMIHSFFTLPKYLKEARMLEAQVSFMLNHVFMPT